MAKLIGYLVKPAARTIERVEIEEGRGTGARDTLKQMYALLECELVDVVRLSDGVTVFVDDEGLLHDPQHFCRIASFPAPLAGNLLFLGDPDEDGFSTSCPWTIDQIGQRVHVITRGDPTWSAVKRLEAGE